MDLPINDKELEMIVWMSEHISGDGAEDLHKKLKLVKEVRDENPKDTVSIKFATPADARATVAKVKKINKPYARKIQILTVGEQRAKVMGKTEVVAIFKKAKESLKRAHERKKKKV